jgi:hypothetical protein
LKNRPEPFTSLEKLPFGSRIKWVMGLHPQKPIKMIVPNSRFDHP